VFLFDFSEDFISAPEFLLFGVLIYILLHKAVERNDIRVKRRNEGDVSKLNPADGGR
jgi:hypothetical protein